MQQYQRQSPESYAEQKIAINFGAGQLDSYRNANQSRHMTYIKNTIIYGAPGAGKLFVGEFLVLYAITLGLNIISTALMGVRANALGVLKQSSAIPSCFMLC